MKAAFVAMEGCTLWSVAVLQKVLFEHGWIWRTHTLENLPVLTDGGLRLATDGSVETASPRDYQLVLLAGSKLPENYEENLGLQRFLRQFDGQGGWIAAIGSSVLYLAAAGLLGGRHFTTSDEIRRRYSNLFANCIFTNEEVSIDGNIITSQDHAYKEFTSAVCGRLGIVHQNLSNIYGYSLKTALK